MTTIPALPAHAGTCKLTPSAGTVRPHFGFQGETRMFSLQSSRRAHCAGVVICLVTAVVAIVATPALAAPGQTVLIDFGNNTSFRGVSVPAPDANGHFWNSLQPWLFYSNLNDITNTPTTFDFGFDTPVGTDSFNGPAGVTSSPPTAAEIAATDIDAAALGNLGVKEAAMDFAAGPGGADNRARFQIQQL